MDNDNFNNNLVEFNLKTKIRTSILNIPSIEWLMINTIKIDGCIYVTPLELYNLLGCHGGIFLTGKANDEEMNFINDFYNLKSNWKKQLKESIDADFKKWKEGDRAIVIQENTHVKDFAIQVVKYLEDHYGEHNYKCFLEVVNDKLK